MMNNECHDEGYVFVINNFPTRDSCLFIGSVDDS